MLRSLSSRSTVRLAPLPPPSLLLEARGVSSSRWLERFVQHLALCRTDYRCGTPHERRPMWSRSLSRAARASVHRTVALGSLVLLFGTASRHAEAAVVAIVPSSYVAGTGGGADPNADLSLPNANVASGSYGWFLNFRERVPPAKTSSSMRSISLCLRAALRPASWEMLGVPTKIFLVRHHGQHRTGFTSATHGRRDC